MGGALLARPALGCWRRSPGLGPLRLRGPFRCTKSYALGHIQAISLGIASILFSC
jgi:hypothetical protein